VLNQPSTCRRRQNPRCHLYDLALRLLAVSRKGLLQLPAFTIFGRVRKIFISAQ
jgi:hypothetical protein